MYNLFTVCEIIKERSAAGMLHGVTYSIGGVAVTAIAHLFPHWRHFQLACALCYILYIPYYWYTLYLNIKTCIFKNWPTYQEFLLNRKLCIASRK